MQFLDSGLEFEVLVGEGAVGEAVEDFAGVVHDENAFGFTVAVVVGIDSIGIEVTQGEAVDLLRRMRHGAEPEGERTVAVEIPAYRNDILHDVDLLEDLAIAYGYDKIPKVLLPVTTKPYERPVEVLSNKAREILAGLGLIEVMTLVLTNPETNDLMLGREPSYRFGPPFRSLIGLVA